MVHGLLQYLPDLFRCAMRPCSFSRSPPGAGRSRSITCGRGRVEIPVCAGTKPECPSEPPEVDFASWGRRRQPNTQKRRREMLDDISRKYFPELPLIKLLLHHPLQLCLKIAELVILLWCRQARNKIVLVICKVWWCSKFVIDWVSQVS